MNSPELGSGGISTTSILSARRSRTSDSGIVGGRRFLQHRERAVRTGGIWAHRGILCLILAIAVVVVCLSYRLEMTDSSQAAATDSPIVEQGDPKIVMGKVYDRYGNPAVSVRVNVSMKAGSTVLKTLNNTTDSSGFYIVTFSPTDWQVGNTIVANATIGSDTVWNSTTANSDPTQIIDLRFALIPEFGGGVLLAVFGTVIVMAIASRLRR